MAAKVDLKALARAFGGDIPSPDILVGRGMTSAQATRQRNVRAVARAKGVQQAIKSIRKRQRQRGEPVTQERAAEILRNYAKPAQPKEKGRGLGERILHPSPGDIKRLFQWTWEH